MRLYRHGVAGFLPITLCCFLLAAAVAAMPQAAESFQAGQELTVVNDRSTPPFSYLDHNNRPAGITFELWRLWSRKTGVPVRFVLVPRHEEAAAMLRGDGPVFTGIFLPDAQPDGIRLSRPLLEIPFGIFYHRHLPSVKTPEDLRDAVLGVVKGFPGEAQLRARYPQLRLQSYPGPDDMIKAAVSGSISAFACPHQVGLYYLNRLPDSGNFRYCTLPVSIRWLQAGVAGANPLLLDKIQSGFDAITEQEVRRIQIQEIGLAGRDDLLAGLRTLLLPAALAGLAGLSLFALRLVRQRRRTRENLQQLNRHVQESALSHRALQRSEEWLRTTLDSIGDAVIVTDAQGLVVRLNPVAETLTGWRTESAVGRPLPEVFHIVNAGTRQIVENPARKVLTLGQIVGLANHTVLISRKGREYQIADSGSPIRSPEGAITGVVLVFRDVTEEYKRQRQTEEAEQRLRLAVEGTGAGIWDLDVSTGRLTVNDRWARMLGYEPEELEPVTLETRTTLCHSEDLKKSLLQRERHFDGETDHYECEIRLRHKNGCWVWVLDRGRVAKRDELGRPLRMLGTHTDISERKNAEAAVRKRLVALTRPLEDAGELSFQDLFDIGEIQQLQDLVADATGVASIITAPDGVPITRASNFCRLCRDIIRRTERGCANCYRSDAALGRYNPDGPVVCPCLSGGLWDAGAGIFIGSRHIANWLIGQVRDETQTEESMLRYAREIGADEQEFLAAFREVPSMSQERFRNIARMVFQIANRLSDMAYQNIQQARFISERKSAEERLRISEENLRATLDSIGDAVIATDTAGLITRLNPIAAKLTGWTQEEALRQPLDTVFRIVNAETRQPAENPAWKVLETGEIVGLANHTALLSRTGAEYQIADSGAPITDDNDTVIGVVLVFRDVTGEYALQEQLLQSRKMDAIGQLAGGVAHDFNNMLGGIVGSAELLLPLLQDNPQGREYLDLILTASRRAGDLTGKLLSFARKGKSLSTPLDVHLPLSEAATLLQRSVDKRISIRLELKAGRSMVVGDDSQLQNAFLNLGLNAAQAMPGGGSLVFRSRAAALDAEDCRLSSFDLQPGDYIEIEVEDTGSGIRPEHLPRIFEPFFTTKEPGKGTGLGLAAVYGAIEQHHGEITVRSTPGRGTTFLIRLPLSDREPLPLPADSAPEPRPAAGRGRILVIDDEEIIRITADAILRDLGYTTFLCPGSEEALEFFRREHGNIDLVLLDMMMPGLSGRECFRLLREIDPACRVILFSGFSQDSDLQEFREAGLAGFLRKPFHSAELSQTVARALAGLPPSDR